MATSEYAPAQQQIVNSWETREDREDAIYVQVNREVLDRIARENPELTVPDWRFPGEHPTNDWAFATQVIVSSVINFHFLNRNRERDGEGWSMIDPTNGRELSASNALHPRLYQNFGEAENITADQIRQLTTFHGMYELLPGESMEHARRTLLKSFADA